MTERVMSSEAGASETRDANLGVRGLWESLTKPSEFFAKIKRRPVVLVGYLAIGLAYLLVMYLLSDLIAEMQLKEMAKNPQMQAGNMPTHEQMKVSVLLFGTIAMLLTPLALAALGMFWGNFVMAGRATFKQLLSVMVYGEWAYALASLVIVPMVLAKGSIAATLSLAVFLPNQDVTSPLWVLLSKISLQHIFEFFIVAIGLERIYGVTRNKGYLLAVLTVGVLALMHVMTTVIGSMF